MKIATRVFLIEMKLFVYVNANLIELRIQDVLQILGKNALILRTLSYFTLNSSNFIGFFNSQNNFLKFRGTLRGIR